MREQTELKKACLLAGEIVATWPKWKKTSLLVTAMARQPNEERMWERKRLNQLNELVTVLHTAAAANRDNNYLQKASEAQKLAEKLLYQDNFIDFLLEHSGSLR